MKSGKQLDQEIAVALAASPETTDQKRDLKTGQYSHHNKWERRCKCGHTLGVHSAEKAKGKRPCFVGDFEDTTCDCENFRLAKDAK